MHEKDEKVHWDASPLCFSPYYDEFNVSNILVRCAMVNSGAALLLTWQFVNCMLIMKLFVELACSVCDHCSYFPFNLFMKFFVTVRSENKNSGYRHIVYLQEKQ